MELYHATLAECIEHVEHIKALGIKLVYLADPPYPWEHVTACDSLAKNHISLGTSPHVRFEARHPCGLKIEWSHNIVRSTNHDGLWEFDPENEPMLQRLPAEHVATVRRFATSLAEHVRDDILRYRRSQDAEELLASRLEAFAK